MQLAPGQNLGPQLYSRTGVLHGCRQRPDQMMVRSVLALHLFRSLVFLSLFHANHTALCPGLVYNGLLAAILGDSLG